MGRPYTTAGAGCGKKTQTGKIQVVGHEEEVRFVCYLEETLGPRHKSVIQEGQKLARIDVAEEIEVETAVVAGAVDEVVVVRIVVAVAVVVGSERA